MLRSKALTGVALLSLALGIGANTAIFSLLDAVLLRSLPVKDPQRLVLLGRAQGSGVPMVSRCRTLLLSVLSRAAEAELVFSDTAATISMRDKLYGFIGNDAATVPMAIQAVSGTYFSTLGVEAEMGRMLTDADDNSEGDHPVVVISDAWWKRAMGKNPAVLGRTIKLGSTVLPLLV